MSELSGKVALVTGAASGIGEACVARFLDDGARGRGRRPRRSRPSTRRRSRLDVRDEGAVADVVATVVEEHGRLDAVVTAAGVAGGGPAHLVDRDEWQRVLDINLTGTFLVCKHAIAQMLEQEPVDGERGSARDDRERRRARRHGGRQLVQRVEGRGRHLHEEPRDRLRRVRASARTRSAPGSSRRRCSTASSACPAWKRCAPTSRTSTSCAGSGGPRRSRRSRRSSSVADASFVTGQAIAVDGGYTAGRDHGVTELMGL